VGTLGTYQDVGPTWLREPTTRARSRRPETFYLTPPCFSLTAPHCSLVVRRVWTTVATLHFPIPDASILPLAEVPMSTITTWHLRMLAALLFAGQLMNPSWAQKGEPPYPSGSEITFEWDYSCPSGRGCSFDCPGRGGASHVTKLTIYLGTVPVGSLRNTPALFYDFSTREISRGNGFIVSTGLSTLSCQVNGMTLDYSGPAKFHTSLPPTAEEK